MNRVYKRLRLLWLASSPVWIPAVGLGETIDHGDLGPGSRVAEATEIPGCDPLPEDPGLIPDLQTGWARMVNGNLHVLLSDVALGCPGPNGSSDATAFLPGCGTAMWTLNYDLPEEMQAVGVYNLADHVVNWDFSQRSEGEAGVGCGSSCATTTVGASFIPGNNGPDAELEIYGINDRCITGRISGLNSSGQSVPPPPELNGAFRAVRCD